MPKRYSAIAVLTFALCPAMASVAAISPEAAALEVIDDCLAAAETDVLECPQLAPALAATPLPGLLTGDITGSVTQSGLRDLASFLRDYGCTGTAAVPNPAAVSAVLAELPSRPEATLSAWRRFLEWLEQWLPSNDDAVEDFRWLASIDLPAWLPNALYYTMLALLAAFSAGFVIMELRAARRSGRRARSSASRRPADTGQWPPLTGIARLDAARQPGALLRFVIRALGEQRRLTDDASLTNRELRQDLMARDPVLAERFGDFAARVEMHSYGGEDPAYGLPPLVAAAEALVAARHEPRGGA